MFSRTCPSAWQRAMLQAHRIELLGKTTLLRVLCGRPVPESGEALWRSRAVSGPDADYAAELAYLGHAMCSRPT